MSTTTNTKIVVEITDAYVKSAMRVKRAEINLGKRYAEHVAEFKITPETVGAHVKAMRLATFPGRKSTDKDVKNMTDRYRKGLLTALGVVDGDGKSKSATPVLRVTLSGEGGGSAVIPTDHPHYASLVALVRGDK